MKYKINVAELLKNRPKGMWLDCTTSQRRMPSSQMKICDWEDRNIVRERGF